MKKIYLILLAAFVILISVSCVSASDNTNMTVNGGGDVSGVSIHNPGNFTDLNNDIKNIHSGETFNFTRNYVFGDGYKYLPGSKVIKITQNNIVINGNGFTIDAGGDFENFQIFDVLGNNVTINNLIFINSQPNALNGPHLFDGNTQYVKINSPVNWKGNDGHMYNCTFCNNVAVNGGALNWQGSNGTVNHCLFINNTAAGVGGALCIGGENNTVSNCVFINCTSKLTGEAIFAENKRKNINFINDTFTNKHPIVDGASLKFDANYLFYSRMVYVGGDASGNGFKINLVPLLYSAIVNGGVINYNNKIKYYVQCNNETHAFTLNFNELTLETTKNSLMYYKLDYTKSFCFTNITEFNQLFDLLIHGNYDICVAQNRIANLVYGNDYKLLTNLKAGGCWYNCDKGIKNIVNQLTVKFHGSFNINCDATWDLSK